MALIDSLLLDPCPLNVWVAVRSDGALGSGTVSDPWNARSSPTNPGARFDAVMNALPVGVPVLVHLGPGVFETKGFTETDPAAGWQARGNMRILGSGIGVTVLKLVGAALTGAQYFAIGHPLGASGTPANAFELADLTIDCNLAGQPAAVAAGAVRIKGSHARLRQVRAINWGTRTTAKPCYVLALITADAGRPTEEIFSGVIEDCSVILPDSTAHLGGTSIALHVGEPGGATGFPQPRGESAVIRNCLVDGAFWNGGQWVPDLARDIRGLSASWGRGVVLEKNQIHNVRYGGPCQTGEAQAVVPEVVLRGNLFRNVVRGVSLTVGGLAPAVATAGPALVSISSSDVLPILKQAVTSAPHGLTLGCRVKISGNTFDGAMVRVATPPATTAFDFYYAPISGSGGAGYLQAVLGVERLIVEDNLFELALPSGSDPVPVGVFLDDNGAGFKPHELVIIRRNQFRHLDGAAGPFASYAIQVNGAEEALISNNLVGTVPVNGAALRATRCGVVTTSDNRGLDGGLLDPGTDRFFTSQERPVEEALVLAGFEN